MNNGYLKKQSVLIGIKIFCFINGLIVLLFPFTACREPGDRGNNSSTLVEVDMIRSNMERSLTPELAPGELERLVEGNTAFALDFYHEIEEEPGNFVFSPHSISAAFVMTYAGARTNTELQMAQALHFDLGQERTHEAFNALDLELSRRGESEGESEGTDFKLHMVNASWAQEGFFFLQDYLDLLAVNYGAGMHILDFITAPEDSRQTINNWVLQQSEDRIKNLLPQNSISTLTRFVLTNVIYFYGAWAIPFDENLTQRGNFFSADGDVVSVPMMRFSQANIELISAVMLDGYTAVELPYKRREIAMLILIPDRGRYFEFEQALDVSVINQTVNLLVPSQLQVVMPKFKYESNFQLRNTLTRLGMTEAFDPNSADFSGMTGMRELFIQDAYHKTFISVDEKGTEAAAASAVVIGLTGRGGGLTVTIDRPFIYFIRDIKTNAILFAGRVINLEE